MPSKNLIKSKAAYGLEWKPLTTDNLKSEARAIGKSSKQKLGVINQSDEKAQIGLTNDNKCKGALSAAGIFSDLVNDGLIVESYNKTRFWACLVSDGEVVPGFDFIGTEDDVKRKITDFFQQQFGEEVNDDIPVFGDEESENILTGVFGESSDHRTTSLRALIEESGSEFPKEFSHLRVKPLAANQLGMIIGAAAVAGVAVFVLNGQEQQQYEKPEIDMSGLASMKEEIEEEKEPSVPSKTRQQKMNEAVLEAQREEAKWIKQDFDEREAAAAIKMVVSHAYSSDLVKMGWKLNTIVYDPSGPYGPHDERQSIFGTPNQFADAFGERSRIRLTGDTGQVAFDASIESTGEEPMAFIQRLSEDDKTLNNLMTDLEATSFSWTLANVQDKARRKPAQAIRELDENKSEKRQLDYTQKTIKVTGDTLKGLRHLGNVLEQYPGIVANKITISFINGIAWDFNGEYYEF